MTAQPAPFETFDYIIVGAGSAGCLLANRLSANPATRVLMPEAGGLTTRAAFPPDGALSDALREASRIDAAWRRLFRAPATAPCIAS